MAANEKYPDASYDIIIIGGGISGINAAYRVQQGLPHLSYKILEARDVLGGTWSFFKYPGFRSDSEIASFAFSWSPWDQDTAIADGGSIDRYINNTAVKYGIDKKIQYNTKVVDIDWQTKSQKWLVNARINSTHPQVLHTRFIIMATGYYDYSKPLQTLIPGIDNFAGQRVHPQFWPSDLNYKDKNIVVIGSGATAVTLVPSLSDQAKQVTMLQRSPSYFITIPSTDNLDVYTKRIFPENLAYALIRMRVLFLTFLFIQFCHYMPKTATKVLRSVVRSELPPDHPLDPHFTPSYRPFEQRLCITPDGDFFKAIRDGKAKVVTGQIDTIIDKTIVLKSGEELKDVDIIVTATGLKLHIIGGIDATIDGRSVELSHKFVWRSSCIQDIPNLCFMLGYSDNTWTLGTDSSATTFVRLIKKLEKKQASSFVPTIPEGQREKLVEIPIINLSSGYIQKAKNSLPRTATTQPWKPRWHYFADFLFARFGNVEKGMKMVKATEVEKSI